MAQFAAFARRPAGAGEPRARPAPPIIPVTFVSWPDALAYCRWLEAALKASPTTPPQIATRLGAGWHVTLPTEAQWEKAARGGDRRRVSRGATRRGATAPTSKARHDAGRQFACPECAYGLADMSGNVWEWTRSPYQPYPYDEPTIARNLEADALWVMRGGHFGDPARLVRTSARGAADPGARRPFIGFRAGAVALPFVALTSPVPTRCARRRPGVTASLDMLFF